MPTAWIAAIDDQLTPFGIKGAGKAPVTQGEGLDRHVSALCRYMAGCHSPEPRTATINRTQGIEEVLAKFDPDARAEVEESLFPSLTHLAYNIAILCDFSGGDELALKILADNGWLPDEAVYEQVDDLLATRYDSPSSDQSAAQTLRAMGAAIAAGEDPWLVLRCISRLGPQSDDFALRIARRAGQALDAATAEGFDPNIYR
ncbi:hypothetical protein K2Z83_20310 [Oscillochloris sp. ZM17-4]|uniref:hypothetical protein n=1 Tax=Oscillochloris sp. ZM17-4 TaxID=2866714 RepID=UPI001C72C487|nr:hypothetical protein [Oscillochloris sp. ZM17-4]MBX0330015.1 hypothetical protein [Oscillochloris sp. ZM17-4]